MELNQREKLWLILGILILVPLSSYRFLYTPVLEQYNSNVSRVETIKTRIQQITLTGQELK